MDENIQNYSTEELISEPSNGNNNISESEFAYSQEVIRKMSDYFDDKVVGQKQLKFSLIASILADGHILIESVPGLAKTTAAKAISDAVDGKFARIQCTPDLLPADIIGTQIYNQATCKFETMLGPVFANFVLLDEVNRSSAKTQSAMLEAMQEKHVTIGGKTYNMPEDIFIVIATQNPIEQEGTYPLSEAQTDRFLIKEVITYPTAAEEVEILKRIESGVISEKTDPVLTIQDINKVQDIADQGFDLGKYVRIGVSPRASIAFLKMAKAAALMMGRTYVTPEDVKVVRHQVLRHRIGLNYSAVADNITVETVIDGIVNSVKTP